MKRFLSAVFLCGSLLAAGSVYFLRSAEAKEDVILELLNMPAPPPPNPLAPVYRTRDEAFYKKSNPPKDDAPIEDLMDYWARQGSEWGRIDYSPKPSPRAMGRLLAEIRANPERASQFLNLFRNEPDGARLVKEIYDAAAANPSLERDDLSAMREWLVDNSPFFSEELERKAARIRDDREYVAGHDELLAFARQDWDRAAPLVNRLYNDPTQPNSRVAALWALYRHANEEGSIGDTDRYREELMKIVEDRTASNAMRDLALDALAAEKEWAGRDDWYFSLLGDETLADLRVNGSSNTGLTTLIMNSPVEKYKDRMIEMAASDNKTIKNAAVRNLLEMLSAGPDEEIIKALVPWLSDPDWASTANESGRQGVVRALAQFKMPESVPGLVNLLNEKPSKKEIEARSELMRSRIGTMSNSNTSFTVTNSTVFSTNAMASATPPVPSSPEMAEAMRAAANVAANAMMSAMYDGDHYPFRYSALSALVKQADMRAAPALRRLLNTTNDYERTMVIQALITSSGFTVPEQVDALVAAVKSDDTVATVGMMANGANYIQPRQLSIQELIGAQLAQMDTVGDDLVRAVIERMDSLERRDPETAERLRKIVQGWDGPAVNMMMLRDLKNGKSNGEAVIKLLANRKDLREKQPTDVFDLRTGGPVAIGLAGCILEDANDMASLLAGGSNLATTAMLACARLIRAELPIGGIVPLLKSEDKMLALAAERYLFSQDSPEARLAYLSLYPNAAKITGSTTLFQSDGRDVGVAMSSNLFKLFSTISPYYAAADYAGAPVFAGDFRALEKRLQEEVIADKDLLGVYTYENFFVRIYADRAVFSVQEDEARYRERVLTAEEFDHLKGLLAYHKVDEQPPFLSCGECEPRQLLMLGRNGGRRVFIKATKMPELFAGLDGFFADMSRSPLKLKYTASKELPGLEVLFADDGMAAISVWKNGPETRLLITNLATRERVRKDIEQALEKAMESDELDEEPSEDASQVNPWRVVQEQRSKRAFEGIEWLGLANDRLAGQVPAPPGFDIPPASDGLTLQPPFERWKARAGDVEIRADNEGLHKVQGGAVKKMKSGYYSRPLITPNGRWVIVNKDGEEGFGLVRVNLQTGREYAIDLGEQPANHGIVFIPSINRFLIGSVLYNEEHYRDHEEGETEEHFSRPDFSPLSFLLLDPETGAFQNAPGEYRPLTHQWFRPLQPSGKPNEYWAAMPGEGKNETVVGIYNAAVFGFKPVLKVPKIQFDSLDMWVDQGKVYFVYKGHLLVAPLSVG